MAEDNGPIHTNRHLFVLGGFPRVMTRQPKWKNRSNDFLFSLRHLCEVSELPGAQIDAVPVQIYGPPSFVPGEIKFQTLPTTFICRDYMREKEFFDDWLFSIKNANRGGAGVTFDNAYLQDIVVDAIVSVFSTEAELNGIKSLEIENAGIQKPRYAVYLRDLFPIQVDPVQLNWQDDQIMKLHVTFSYRFWEPAHGLSTAAQNQPASSTGVYPVQRLPDLTKLA